MAKVRQVIGSAVLDVEGDAAACSEGARVFHLALAQHWLREVENQLAVLKPLQKQRRDLVTTIKTLTKEAETVRSKRNDTL